MVQRQKAWADRHGRQKMFKKGNKALVFNSKVGKHPRKLKLRWLDPYIIEEDIAFKTLKLKNLDTSMNASTLNGHRLKPYYSLEDPSVMSPEILSIQTTPIDVNWPHRKSPDSKDTSAKQKFKKRIENQK